MLSPLSHFSGQVAAAAPGAASAHGWSSTCDDVRCWADWPRRRGRRKRLADIAARCRRRGRAITSYFAHGRSIFFAPPLCRRRISYFAARRFDIFRDARYMPPRKGFFRAMLLFGQRA